MTSASINKERSYMNLFKRLQILARRLLLSRNRNFIEKQKTIGAVLKDVDEAGLKIKIALSLYGDILFVDTNYLQPIAALRLDSTGKAGTFMVNRLAELSDAVLTLLDIADRRLLLVTQIEDDYALDVERNLWLSGNDAIKHARKIGFYRLTKV